MSDGRKPLRRGALLCPECRQRLHFANLAGMRLRYGDGETATYRDRCVTKDCAKRGDVEVLADPDLTP